MAVGIYAMFWETSGKVYIGQSTNLTARIGLHRRQLSDGTHCNYKCKEQMQLYGLPQFIVLQTCLIEDLNILEVSWCEDFNILEDGLNINALGNAGGSGLNAPRSTYSKLDILRVFRAVSLVKNVGKSWADIGRALELPSSLVSAIAKGLTHKWLEEKYPYIHARKVEYTTKPIERLSMLNDNEVEVEIVMQGSKCISHPELYPWAIRNVISGSSKSYQGYKLAKPKELKLLSPKGELEYYRDVPEVMFRHPEFNRTSIISLIKGKIRAYKGWTNFNVCEVPYTIPRFVSPEGEIIECSASELVKLHPELDLVKIVDLLEGRARKHYGWMLLKNKLKID